MPNPLSLFSNAEIPLPANGQAVRWAWYLLLSIALHIALLNLYPSASNLRTNRSSPLEVQLGDSPDRSMREAIPEPLPARQREGAERRDTVIRAPAGQPNPQVEAPAPAAPGDVDRGSLPRTDVLLGIARNLAHDPVAPVELQPGGRYGTGLTASERFARVLRRPEAGERHLENGITKITTPSGTVYCITEPPHFMQSGVVPPMAVPTTCP